MPPKRLILVGGGHSHVLVLAAFAAQPDPRLRISVTSPHRYTTYSGMVPGVIAGQYALRQAQIDVESLTRRAGGAFVAGRAAGVAAAQRILELADASRHSYELLSFDIGAQARPPPATDAPSIVGLRPIERALATIEAALAAPPARPGRRVVVVGAGAGGTEVAFALAARLRNEAPASITVCDEAAHPVAARGRRTAALVKRAFAEHRIRFIGSAPVEQVTRSTVRLKGGAELPADLVIWATGASAPPLFAASALPVDARGFLRVGGDLRCPQRPEIFGAGDCASLTTHPDLPKAGVYAVRQGPLLAHNLTAAAGGEPLKTFRPQKRFLALLNTGDGRAILSYGAFAARGRWAWRLKDWIDRRFMAQFS
jgi:pyridine nucleotide-disulfide oxidoreductase family protein